MLHLIDSHCHLTAKDLREQAEAVVERANACGVQTCITIAEDLADADRALTLAAAHPSIRVVAGIHPHRAAKVPDGWDEELLRLAQRKDVAAVGETGLDYHYQHADPQSQSRVFRRQLEIASEVDKPVVIHCREAHGDVLAVLADFPQLTRVVFHCFTGSENEADDIIARGYWISLAGVVTFKKSEALRAVARKLPADRLMIETDAPYLSPEPVRARRPNEPAHLVHTAQCLAEQRGATLADFAAMTVANTQRFFSLPVEVST